MDCRPSCGACCIAPSINSPILGMPNGKPAGVRCIQLLDNFKCALFGKPERPAFCGSLQPSIEMRGDEFLGSPREHAIAWLSQLEAATKPA